MGDVGQRAADGPLGSKETSKMVLKGGGQAGQDVMR